MNRTLHFAAAALLVGEHDYRGPMNKEVADWLAKWM